MKQALVVLLAAALCAATAQAADPQQRWQAAATGADRQRLARLWPAWTRALAQVQAAGEVDTLKGFGAITAPDPAMMNAEPAPSTGAAIKGVLPGVGTYRCRTIRLGYRAAPASAGVVQAGAILPCRIEQRGSRLWFATTGPSRLSGQLYADGDRLVLLGTVGLGGEMGRIVYGADVDRDVVGVLQPVSLGKWRLELPWPNWQSTLDIVEITPA